MAIDDYGMTYTMSPSDFVAVNVNGRDRKIALQTFWAQQLFSAATKTGAYTLAQTDNNAYLLYDSATDNNVTLPSLNAGISLALLQLGTGAWKCVAGTGCTLIGGPTNPKTSYRRPLIVQLIKPGLWLLSNAAGA